MHKEERRADKEVLMKALQKARKSLELEKDRKYPEAVKYLESAVDGMRQEIELLPANHRPALQLYLEDCEKKLKSLQSMVEEEEHKRTDTFEDREPVFYLSENVFEKDF